MTPGFEIPTHQPRFFASSTQQLAKLDLCLGSIYLNKDCEIIHIFSQQTLEAMRMINSLVKMNKRTEHLKSHKYVHCQSSIENTKKDVARRNGRQ